MEENNMKEEMNVTYNLTNDEIKAILFERISHDADHDNPIRQRQNKIIC